MNQSADPEFFRFPDEYSHLVRLKWSMGAFATSGIVTMAANAWKDIGP